MTAEIMSFPSKIIPEIEYRRFYLATLLNFDIGSCSFNHPVYKVYKNIFIKRKKIFSGELVFSTTKLNLLFSNNIMKISLATVASRNKKIERNIQITLPKWTINV